MKQILILALAGVGAYAIYQWYTKRSPNVPAGANAMPGTTPNPLDFSLVYPDGENAIVSGVPAFNATAVEAGHGDQFAASQHDNPLSTMTGPYMIPFGPDANQGGTMLY